MRGLLFLFSALFLLELTKGMKYDELNDDYREIVDNAIEHGNKDHGQDKHLDFYEIRVKHNTLNVILRPTSCDKITQSVHQKHCKILNKTPQVSCIYCNRVMMEPCLPLRKKEEITKKMNECPRKHFTGSANSMFQKGGNKQQLTGCLGCI